jgi:hypothetical protein
MTIAVFISVQHVRGRMGNFGCLKDDERGYEMSSNSCEGPLGIYFLNEGYLATGRVQKQRRLILYTSDRD